MSSASSSAIREPSRRVFPRYALSVPVELKALRSGIPEDLPGRCTDISETGLGAVIAGELSSGQQVAIELRLPRVGLPVRARAIVRYQKRLHCGLELVGLSPDQRDMIRYWIHRLNSDETESVTGNSEADFVFPSVPHVEAPPAAIALLAAPTNTRRVWDRFWKVRLNRRAYAIVAISLVVFAVGWFRWEMSWRELEHQSSSSNSIRRVSEETMASRILTRVDPVYPEAARKLKADGPVVLDAMISASGGVQKLRPISGPDSLVSAAETAVIAWKFEPYQANGQAVPVETTISVEFHSK